MHIFFWLLIIAISALIINLLLFFRMKRKKNAQLLPIAAVTLSAALLIMLLCACTCAHGTELLSSTAAADFTIEPQSYQTQTSGMHNEYAFCSTEGITFHFDDTQLLSADVPAHPTTVELYSCRIRNGYSICYLSDETVVRYLLK